nr:magnesium-translocating P-type ATPase [Flavisolibacter ginsenosidimutans]
METSQSFWQQTTDTAFLNLRSSVNGLSAEEARKRMADQGETKTLTKPWIADAKLLLSQFKSPLILLLLFAVIVSTVLGEYSNSLIVLLVLLTSGVLGFVQERNAGRAVQALQALIHTRATVRRDGKVQDVLIEEVVKGDIVLLRAGDMIPADALVLEANDLHVNESVLTGESFAVEKFAGESFVSSLNKASNAVFKGTSVINGTATVVAVKTGSDSELGKIAGSIQKAAPLTSFEKGITSFGKFLVWLTVIISSAIFVFNLFFHRPFFDSLLFSLALAVGIAPALLPAILTLTLSAGARRMAAQKVIVKKLSAIQNLGEIDVLCCDKTGTITEGVVQLQTAADSDAAKEQALLRYAYLNASFESGFANPIDEAIRQQKEIDITGYTKCDEVPYDFIRKRLSIVAEKDGRHLMITKGSFNTVLDVCTTAEEGSDLVPITAKKDALKKQFEAYSDKGFRVLAIAVKDVTGDPVINKDDECEMIFAGLLLFADPLKEDVLGSIQKLRSKGVSLKIITGDNYRVAQYIASQINLSPEKIVTGAELATMNAEELKAKVAATDLFAETLPAQKEAIIKALQNSGCSVGYLGDGINDASALKAADVGISVQGAVDVAKEAADMVLLDRHLDVINNGIEEGRKTFMNTLKYIFVTTSANFGNMFSMAIASLLLPFIPLLPIQILLNNFLSDIPAFGIASDAVDKELVRRPQKWNIAAIRRFMVVFGLQSSLFDFATFGLLYFVFRATPPTFRTAWFTESLLTQVMILWVIRTKRPFFKSKPAGYLRYATLAVFVVGVSLSYWPFAKLFAFLPLPLSLLAGILLITLAYLLLSEQTKRWVYKRL